MRHLIPAVLLLSGCVLSSSPRNTKYSVDITQMQKADFYQESWVYHHPKIKISDYKNFIVEPCQVYANPRIKIKKKDRPPFDTLAQHLTKSLRDSLSKQFSVVETPSSDTLRLAVSIIDIKPIVTLKKPDGQEVVITDTTIQGTKMEIDCTDSQTNETIFSLSTLFRGEEFAAYLKHEQLPRVEQAYYEWADYFRSRLYAVMEQAQ